MNGLKSNIKKILSDPIARGTVILFVGMTGVNVMSYLFNLIIGRMLGVVQYGEFLSLVTIVYLMSIPFGSIPTIVVKYVSQLNAQSESEKIKSLLIMLTKYFGVICIIVSVLVMSLTPILMQTLKITDPLLIILASILFTAFNVPNILNVAFNGLEKFGTGTLLGGISIGIRIAISVVAIWLGFGVGGVFTAMIVSSLLIYGVSWYVIDSELQKKYRSINLISKAKALTRRLFTKVDGELVDIRKDIVAFAIPASLATIGVAALTQLDIILVKIYFSPYDAGIYSSLAIIGKVIPFFTIPLLTALFPQLVVRVTRGEEFLKPFYAVLGTITVASSALAVIYFLFPEQVIRIFFTSQYLTAAPYIGLFGVFQAIYAIMNAYVTFFIAIGKNTLAAQSILAALMQVVLITLFHSDLREVIIISTAICATFSIYYTFCTVKLAYSKNKAE